MNSKPPGYSKGKPADPRERRPRLLFWCVLSAAVLLAGVIGLRSHLRQRRSEADTASLTPPAQSSQAGQRGSKLEKPAPRSETEARASDPTPAVTPQTLASTPVDPAMSGLVAGLLRLGGANAPLTAEAVQTWRTNLQQLVASGVGAVPALQAFLGQNQDAVFDSETARALGYRTARLAAFDALRQIGGPEATAVLDRTLGETTSPKEIAALAFELDQLAQGQYRDKALGRVRDALAAVPGTKTPAADVGPLFETLQRYGDASVVPDLEKASGQWKYYAVSALAHLPDEAGLPSLIKMADPSSGSGNTVIALEMIAQLASTSETAHAVLAAQIANNQIPQNLWPYLIGPLAGDQYYPVEGVLTAYPSVQSWSDVKSTHIAYGNQNLYQLPSDASLTADGLNQRMVLVNELMAATKDPAALQTLQQVQTTLQNRLARVAAGPR